MSDINVKEAARLHSQFIQLRVAVMPDGWGDEDSPTSLLHLFDMCVKIINDGMNDFKANRWLGYIQGVLVRDGLMTLQEAKDFNSEAKSSRPDPSSR